MTNAKNVLLASFRELLTQWQDDHDRLLKNAMSKKMKVSNGELQQLEAVLLNIGRLQGLILWLEQNEQIKIKK